MSTVKAAVVDPAVIVTVLSPSSAAATKSLPATSDTVRFTVRSAAGAGDAVTVNVAELPSVTAVPAEMVMVGTTTTSSSAKLSAGLPDGSTMALSVTVAGLV